MCHEFGSANDTFSAFLCVMNSACVAKCSNTHIHTAIDTFSAIICVMNSAQPMTHFQPFSVSWIRLMLRCLIGICTHLHYDCLLFSVLGIISKMHLHWQYYILHSDCYLFFASGIISKMNSHWQFPHSHSSCFFSRAENDFENVCASAIFTICILIVFYISHRELLWKCICIGSSKQFLSSRSRRNQK